MGQRELALPRNSGRPLSRLTRAFARPHVGQTHGRVLRDRVVATEIEPQKNGNGLLGRRLRHVHQQIHLRPIVVCAEVDCDLLPYCLSVHRLTGLFEIFQRKAGLLGARPNICCSNIASSSGRRTVCH